MLSRLRLAGPFAGILLTIFLVASAGALADPPPGPGHSGQYHKAVCPGPASPGNTRCDAQVVTDSSGTPLVTGGPTRGYQPVDLQAAYNLVGVSGSAGAGRTIAIVDAYHDPNAAADLVYYRGHVNADANGNPLPSIQTSGCSVTTSTTPCFQQVNQNGGTTPPASNASWSQEISLDLDMASAICPKCNILLVEANSSYMSDLGTAENQAVTLGATAISNSWGGGEFSSETSYDSAYFNHSGIPITVSSGDSGYGVEYPASSPNVTAVGGTHLVKSSTGTWSESAWSGAGSGCSAVELRPGWQTGITGVSCTRRLVADVSAVADPNTGVSVYDTYAYAGQSGWLVFGGTSVASPIVASVYALAGNSAGPGFPYANNSSSTLHDVTSGRNGHCNRDPKLCTAGPGWDGPTGLGTPNGTGAF